MDAKRLPEVLKLGKDQFISISVGLLGAVLTSIAVLASGWGGNRQEVISNTKAIAEVRATQREDFKILREDIRQVGDDVKEINRYLRNTGKSE